MRLDSDLRDISPRPWRVCVTLEMWILFCGTQRYGVMIPLQITHRPQRESGIGKSEDLEKRGGGRHTNKLHVTSVLLL